MTEESSLVLQGGASSAAVAFLHVAVLRMIPYSVPALALVALDLLYGIRASRDRGEKVRFSTAIRRTVTKIFSYLCWLILASTLTLAFKVEWLEWGVLGLVYANEFASIVGNYLETKGLEISLKGFYKWLIKVFAGKIGADMSDDEANEIIKEGEPKAKPRDARGRFVKRK